MSDTTPHPATTAEPAKSRRTAGLAVALVVGLLAGFLGGIAGAAIMAPDATPGPRGVRGADGAQGPTGKQGETGKTGKAGADGKTPTQIGICYSTTDNSSNSVYFLTGVYISSPEKNADGTTSCSDGNYVPATPQALPPGD